MYPLLELPYAQRPNHSFLTVPMAVRSHDGDLFVSDAGTGAAKKSRLLKEFLTSFLWLLRGLP
jgi:hypothetical protein